MIASHQRSDDELQALCDRAVALERAGEYQRSLRTLSGVIDALALEDKYPQYLYEWRARLHSALGEHEQADASLQLAAGLAHRAKHRPGAFRMTVARAENAIAARDLEKAEWLLSGLQADGVVLGPTDTARRAEIFAWLHKLQFSEHPSRNLSPLRCETGLVLATLWMERGKYSSALALISTLERELEHASESIRIDQVQLLEVELALEAGELRHAAERLQPLLDDTGAVPIDRARFAVVRARLSLTSGRLAASLGSFRLLQDAPVGDPQLFTAAAQARVSYLIELNRWKEAEQAAIEAIDALDDSPMHQPLRLLLERAKAGAAAHGRSLLSVWELPLTPALSGRAAAASLLDIALRPTEESGDSEPDALRTRWTNCFNQILQALADEELDRAEGLQAHLDQLTAGIESSYVRLRVRLSAAMIAYYRAPTGALVDELRDLADELRDMGARGVEAQASRFAAWAAAKLGRTEDYAALATRASTTIEEIAAELPPEERARYLLNKWNGRDELVAAKMRAPLQRYGGPERIPIPELCLLFREIQALSEWPIDYAFGEHEASSIAGATVDRAQRWLDERLAARSTPGFCLRSPRSLWRLSPRTMVLHYHVHPDRTYLFRMTHRHLELQVLPIGRIHLAGGSFREEIDDDERCTELARHTGIAETLQRFPKIRRLVIVPHDAMANVPFAALRVDGERLCQRVALSQLDRLSSLRRRRLFPRRSLPGVAIGLTDYRGAGGGGGARIPDLPGAEKEALEISRLLAPGSRKLTAEAATCDAALNALATAQRVHIAAHGMFSSEDPASSGVLLRDGGGHRTLTLRELRALRDGHAGGSRGAELDLVTLATCRSAEAALLPGGARICLPNAFLQAGARGVVASLWEVGDDASAALMPAFYRALQTQRAATALATAQRDAAREHWRPSDWAGFVFYGND